MFLKQLQLTNYRNYSDLTFTFKTPTTILIGNNAQGKSNFLEAIYFLATTKSLKADEDEQLIKKDEDFLRVEGEIVDDNQELTHLEIAMQRQPLGLVKKVKVNNLPRRIVDYIGHFYVVSFSPEDINLTTQSPSLRRWHVDLNLAQVDKNYKKALTLYSEVVSRKNKVLKRIKEGIGKVDELTYWSDQQIIFGEIIQQKRQEFFLFLNNTEKTFPPINGGIEYEYIKNEISKERLDEYLQKEVWNATSLIGPHRDDFKFISKNTLNQKRDLSAFGSRGEQRTAVLDLKISEVAFIEKVTGQRPLLLLDDVFSELDAKHRQHVIRLITKQQTILVAVEIDNDLKKQLNQFNLFSVENAQLVEITGK